MLERIGRLANRFGRSKDEIGDRGAPSTTTTS
jgi:hypothetical protein